MVSAFIKVQKVKESAESQVSERGKNLLKTETGKAPTRRVASMSLTTIKLTEFRVEKLRCIGGQRSSSPYRITLFEGGTLGKMGSVATLVAEEMAGEMAGEIAEAGNLKSANHDNFEQHRSRGFKRLLNIFGL